VAAAEEGLTERQKLIRQMLQQDGGQPPAPGPPVAAEGLTERQKLVRQMLHQDSRVTQRSSGGQREGGSPPAQHPPLMCGTNDYAINESGRRITVRDADGLKSAMRDANAGDVIELSAGDYGWVTLNDLQFSDYVKIKGTEGAKLQHLGLTNVKNLQLEKVNFEYGSAEGQNWKPKLLEMKNAQNVRIIDSSFVGNKNTTTWGEDIPEIAVRAYSNSKNIVIAGSKISHVMRAVIFQQVDGYLIENNSLINIGCDGLFFQNSSNGVIESNYLSDFHPFIYAKQGQTCHADFIQFDAGKGRNTRTPSSNVTIRGNVMLQGQDGSSCSGIGSVCGAVQGVFFGGAMGIHPDTGKEHKFTNITIAENIYCASGRNGLAVSNGRNVRIINNAHYTCPPPFGSNHTSNIVLRDTQIGSEASGNIEMRVANQMEAINDAKAKSNLNNCVVKNL
jgi:hypothetical protein